jgi:tRNA(Ile)-lysidine synthetase-like protein
MVEMTLAKRLLQHCHSELPFLAGSRLAVAVSGGLDSVVLLDLLCELRRPLQLELVVATVDHGTRPGDSAGDAAFVRGLARARGLPCYCGRFAGLAGRGREDAARRARLAFLRGVPAEHVALAHHLDDQAETVLLRLLRAASLEALGGMRAHRAPFVRPLLGVPRERLIAWARDRGLLWREDASNEDPSVERNRIRHAVMPGLEVVHGGVRERLVALAGAARDELVASAQLSGLEPPPPAPLRRVQLGLLPRAVALRQLHAWLSACLGSPHGLGRERLIQGLELVGTGRPGAWQPLPGGWRLALTEDAALCLPPPPSPVLLRLPGVRRWGVHNLAVERLGPDRTGVLLRGPIPGERFGGQPLREWLRRRGVPAALRPYHPVFAVADRVLWVPGGDPMEGAEGALGLAITVFASIPSAYACGRPWNATL